MQSQNRSLGGFPSLGDLCMFFTLGNRCTFSCSGHRNPNTYGASSSEYYDLEGWFPRRLATSLFPQVLKTVIKKLLLKGHSHFWDRADLDTRTLVFLTFKKVHPNLESKFIKKSAPIFAVFRFIFNRFLKNLFLNVLLLILWYYFYQICIESSLYAK